MPVPDQRLDLPRTRGGLPHRRRARRGAARQRPRARARHRSGPEHTGAVRVGHRRGCGRSVGDARIAGLPPLHLGHFRRAQGVPVQPGPAGAHRGDRGADVRAPAAGRLLPLHAAVPLQCAHGRLGAGAHGGVGRRPPRLGPLLGFGLSPRRAGIRRDLLQLRRQAAVLHSRHARAARRRRQSAGARLRQRRDHR